MTRARGHVRVALVVAASLGALAFLRTLNAQALPRYSARYEQNCLLCHANPTGAGMRSTYASQQLVPKELAWSKATPQRMAAFDPQLSKSVVIGADFREMYLATDFASAEPIQSGFFQMQQAIYLLFQLDPRMSLYVDRGSSDTYEVFGTAYLLPMSGYLKAGRFVPSYGWKFDDHTMYVRSELGFFPPSNNDVGVELGFTPERWDLQVAVVNGARGRTSDNDRRVAEVLNGLYRFHAGPVAIGAGLSAYRQPQPTETFLTGGTHGYLQYGLLTWVGEEEWARHDPRAAGAPSVTSFTASHEVSLQIHRGLDGLATYDFTDPDLEKKSGARTRWGIGAHLLATPFVGADVLFRRTHDETPGAPDRNSNEGVFQLHLLF